MNKTIKTILLLAAALAAAGCAKTPEEGANDANVRYFNAWMEVNYPGLQPSGLGIYVIEEEEGTGVEVKEDGFIIADYVISDLEGNISSYTSKDIAKQLIALYSQRMATPGFGFDPDGAWQADFERHFEYGKEKSPDLRRGFCFVPTFVGQLQNQSSKHLCVIGSSPRLWGNGSAL